MIYSLVALASSRAAITLRLDHAPSTDHSPEVLTDRLTTAMGAVAAVNARALTGRVLAASTDTETTTVTSSITHRRCGPHYEHSSHGRMSSVIWENQALHLQKGIVTWKTTLEVSLYSLLSVQI